LILFVVVFLFLVPEPMRFVVLSLSLVLKALSLVLISLSLLLFESLVLRLLTPSQASSLDCCEKNLL